MQITARDLRQRRSRGALHTISPLVLDGSDYTLHQVGSDMSVLRASHAHGLMSTNVCHVTTAFFTVSCVDAASESDEQQLMETTDNN